MNSIFAYKSIVIACAIVIIFIIIKKLNQDELPVPPPSLQIVEATGPAVVIETEESSEQIKPLYTKAWKGSYCGITQPRTIAVRDKDTWEKIWLEFTQDRPRRIFLPQVDFSKNTVIVLTMGEKQRDGYGIRIDSILQQGDVLIVTYKETQPDLSVLPATDFPCQPYHLKVTPYTAPKIQFKKL